MTSAPWRAAPSWAPPQPRHGSSRSPAAAPGRSRAATAGRRLRRAARRARRPLAALLLAGATALVVQVALRPAETARGVSVVVAARDLPAGADLAGGTQTVELPTSAVPQGALVPADSALAPGARLASPVRRGEVLTDVRLSGAAGLLASLAPGEVALPVPVASPLPEGLVSPGQRVAVLTGAEGGAWAEDGPAAPAAALVDDAVVLAVSSGATAGGLLPQGAGSTVVVLALPEADAARVASAVAGSGVVLAVTG